LRIKTRTDAAQRKRGRIVAREAAQPTSGRVTSK